MSKCWWFWETQKGTIPDAVWNIYLRFGMSRPEKGIAENRKKCRSIQSPKNVALVNALSAKDDKSM
jgi:hypothetical protein